MKLSRKKVILDQLLATMARTLTRRLAQVCRSRSRIKIRSRDRSRRLPQGHNAALKEARIVSRLVAWETGKRNRMAVGRIGGT